MDFEIGFGISDAIPEHGMVVLTYLGFVGYLDLLRQPHGVGQFGVDWLPTMMVRWFSRSESVDDEYTLPLLPSHGNRWFCRWKSKLVWVFLMPSQSMGWLSRWIWDL